MSNPINKQVFDSRDLIEYRNELEEEIVDFYNEYMSDIDEDWEDISNIDEVSFDEADFLELHQVEIEECSAIKVFCEEISDYSPDFEWGTGIIHEDYFEDYCKELVIDIGDLPKNLPTYIEDNIDWSGVADDLKVDYSEAEYDGDTYYFR